MRAGSSAAGGLSISGSRALESRRPFRIASQQQLQGAPGFGQGLGLLGDHRLLGVDIVARQVEIQRFVESLAVA